MRSAHGIYALAVVALLSAGPALANSARDHSKIDDPTTDATGVTALGIDISFAGNTPDSVRQFMATLSPRRQHGLVNGCRSMVDNPINVNSHVLSVCKNVVSVSGGIPVVGAPPAWGHHHYIP